MRLKKRYTQQGAALLTSLLMVVVIAILGVAVAQQVMSLRKVSAINYDNNLSRNNADSALMEAIAVMDLYSEVPTTLETLSVELKTDVGWWRDDSQWTSATKVSSVTEGEPMYIIEDAGTDNISVEPDSKDVERRFYRVTAKAQGKGDAVTFIQSYYVTVE